MAPFTPDQTDPVSLAITALIAGRNGVSAFVLRTHALELAGYLPGDVVLLDQNATPEPGDIVMAEVQGWPVMKPGAVMRMLQRADPVDLLVAHSLDPMFIPIVVGRERVVIKGVMLPHRLRPTSGR